MEEAMDTLSRLRAGELAGATRLKLCGGLTKFPREVFDLADSLEILDLSGNRLSSLPDDLPRLLRLKILFCSENDFTVFPAVLGECESLEMVAFKSNRIATIPAEAFPQHLRWLILTDNCIGELPATIGKCTGLQKLMLAGNRLETLPGEMAACANLELIRLAANRFQWFPDWLFALPRLAWLGLGGNPWLDDSSGPQLEIPEIDWHDLQIHRQLGQGASGTIHHATWQSSPESEPRDVALKVFKGQMTSDGLPDSEMAVSLEVGTHPNLIGVIGKLTNHPDASDGLLMSLIDPGYVNLAGPPDFDSCSRDVYPPCQIFTPAEVLRAATELASLGAHLHDRHVMHGDFYAHNILRHPSGHCLLGDFGAASRYPAQTSLEHIEVRAFGILLGELLERVEPSPDPATDDLLAELRALQESCISKSIPARPDFPGIIFRLESYLTSAFGNERPW